MPNVEWRSVSAMVRQGWVWGLVMALVVAAPYLRWGVFNHDGQRLAQLLLWGVVLLVCGVPPWNQRLWALWRSLRWALRWALVAVMVLGGVSSVLALYPRWAGLEWAWYGAWLCVVGVLAMVRHQARAAEWDKVLVFGLWLAAALHAAGSVIQYVLMAALGPTTGQPFIPIALYHGFSNVRFFGQWQTMLLPFVVLPLLWWGRGLKLQLLFGGVALWWWMLLIGSGTRASWLGLKVGAVVAAWCGGAVGWRWFRWQAVAVVAGAIAFVVMMQWLPQYFPAPKVLSPLALEFLGLGQSTALTTERGAASFTALSGRGELWMLSLQALRSHPLLGLGPMHIEFNPHNAPLQWMAEWGVVAGLLWCGLAVYGLWRFAGAVRLRVAQRPTVHALSARPSNELSAYTSQTMVAVLAGLVGAMVQAFFDTVVVMPVSLVSLALLSAWGIGFCLREQTTLSSGLSISSSLQAWSWRCQMAMVVVMASFIAAIVVGVAPEIRRVPELMFEAAQLRAKYDWAVGPGFWANGRIYPLVLPNTD